jgi:two-component system LytT family response regulator
MTTGIIIDDEINNTNYLKGLIEKHVPEIELVGTAATVKDGIALIQKTKPALVFLDIELQTATGFDLLSELGKVDFSVIFTTAHERYALKAIKFAALDYLLKPVDIDELKVAVNKALNQKGENRTNENLNVFLENVKKQNQHKKIAVSTSTGIMVTEIKDIIYMQSDGPYTNIYSRDGRKVLTSRHLKEYEELLTEFGFFRLHKSFFVNLAEIKQYTKSDGGYVIMSNNDRVDVSDKKKSTLLEMISLQALFIR